jgi:hypothetical protein
MMTRPNDRELVGLVSPFLLWGLAFVALYASHGAACGLGLVERAGVGSVRLVLSVLLAVFLAAHCRLAFAYWRRWRREDTGSVHFVRLASFILALGALATTAWTGFPVILLSICT